MKSNHNMMLSGVSALAVLSFAAPALAQTQSADGGATTLDEVVVTAQRVETNLQRTPVAVTALGAEALEDRGVTSLLDLNALAPNVSIGTRSGTGASAGTITIRGIGIDAAPPASPAVGVYVDEVYFPGSYGNLLGLFDVARVEILRGPQGTLFGRNTISGAIQYVGQKPILGHVGGFGEFTAGNLDRVDLSAGVNIPIGDVAAIRVSGAVTSRDGYVHDQLNNINRGSDDVKQIRAQLRYQPTDALTVDLKAEYLEQASNGRATINRSFNYNTVLGAPFGPNGLDAFISPDFYTNFGYNGAEFAKSDFKIGQAVVNYELSDTLSLKSITAVSESSSSVRIDNDGTPIPIIEVSRGDITDKLFTQELQLTGNLFSDRLHFTAGAYYYHNDSNAKNNQAAIFGMVSDPFGDYEIKTTSYAVYGQATYDITDRLSVVGGLRYTDESVDAADQLRPDTGSESFDDLSPLLGLNYQASENVLLYVKGSKGFRAGGFSPNAGGYFFFGPEEATTYEAGARMEFLNRRLRINPTVFRTDWDNIQFNSIAVVPGIPFPFPIIENAGDVQIEGFEAEIQAQITPEFSITASGALLHGEYTRVEPSLAGKVTLDSDLKRAPESSFTLGARYEYPLANGGHLAFSGNYAWQADQRSSTTDTENVEIAAYGLINARIEFQPGGDAPWTLSLYGTNLGDEEYAVGGTDYGNGGGGPGGVGGTIPLVSVDVGRPREYGVTLRASF